MTTQEILQDISFLKGKLSVRDADYWVKYNWYLQNYNGRQAALRELYTYPNGFYGFNAAMIPDRAFPAINVARNIIKTIHSKLIQSKGRIYFNGVNSLFKTLKIIRQAQVYFDAFIDRDQLTKKVSACLMDALIFSYGIMWTDSDTKSNERVRPWEFYIDAAEKNYGSYSRAYISQEQYPLHNLKDKIKSGTAAERKLQNNIHAKCIRVVYFDLINKERILFIDGEEHKREKIESENLPFAIIYYDEPIKGLYGNSVMDNVLPVQQQINSILTRVHDALRYSPSHTVYVPYSGNPNGTPGSGPASGKADAEHAARVISNRVGNVVLVNNANGTPVVATPSPISPEYLTHLNFFIQQAFEMEGVSQLSATGKKPSGVNSGVALDTLQDVESERFQALLDGLIQFYKDIYNNMIEVFPASDDILPARLNRAKTKWSEIKKARESFSLETSLASVLSKDPQKKAEQIEKLQMQGVIDPATATTLLDIPDLNRAYSTASASADYCWKVIEDAVEHGDVDYYNVLNLSQCLSMAVNTLCQLASSDEKVETINNLLALIAKLSDSIKQSNGINNPPGSPPPPPPEDTAMNGAQVTALIEIMSGIADNKYDALTARAIMQSAYPTVPTELIDGIFNGYGLPPLTSPPPPENQPPMPVGV